MPAPKIDHAYALVEAGEDGELKIVHVGDKRAVWSLYTQDRKFGRRVYIMPCLVADVPLEERSRGVADRLPRMYAARKPRAPKSKPRRAR